VGHVVRVEENDTNLSVDHHIAGERASTQLDDRAVPRRLGVGVQLVI
jgi:hypothetical protein